MFVPSNEYDLVEAKQEQMRNLFIVPHAYLLLIFSASRLVKAGLKLPPYLNELELRGDALEPALHKMFTEVRRHRDIYSFSLLSRHLNRLPLISLPHFFRLASDTAPCWVIQSGSAHSSSILECRSTFRTVLLRLPQTLCSRTMVQIANKEIVHSPIHSPRLGIYKTGLVEFNDCTYCISPQKKNPLLFDIVGH